MSSAESQIACFSRIAIEPGRYLELRKPSGRAARGARGAAGFI